MIKSIAGRRDPSKIQTVSVSLLFSVFVCVVVVDGWLSAFGLFQEGLLSIIATYI
jgi:hypothetical protein